MTLHVALLRAINLAGRNRVAMSELRQLAAELGFDDARTLLQSGNLVFESAVHTAAELETLLETAAKQRLGIAIEFFVRTAREWQAIVAGNPFPDEAASAPARLLVLCLRDAPTSQAAAALEQAIPGREMARVKGRHAYIVYPEGIGRSRFTSALIEKHLGTRATGRNWNTVIKLADLARR